MKTKFLYLVVALSFIFITTYAFNWINQQNKIEKEGLLHEIKKLKEINQKNNELNAFEVTHKPLRADPSIKLLKENGDTISLKELAKDVISPLFFNYSQFACNSCVDQQLKTLNRFMNQKPARTIYVLTENTQLKNIYLVKRINKAENVSVFRLCGQSSIFKESQIDQILSPKENPFYFILNSDFDVNNVFIPNPYDSVRTTNYLDKIIKQNI